MASVDQFKINSESVYYFTNFILLKQQQHDKDKKKINLDYAKLQKEFKQLVKESEQNCCLKRNPEG